MRWALLSLAGFLSAGCQAYRDRETIEALVASVGHRLRAERSVLGAVEVDGNQIKLLDGSLDLVARIAHDKESPGPSLHVHVRAIPRDRAAGDIDICLVGRDRTAVAEELIANALPPIVSAIRDEPVFGASHAWSDTRNAISGYSSYFGSYKVTSAANSSSVSRLADGLFADLPPLPHDGRMHLVKVVAQAEGGAWRRTIELDGAAHRGFPRARPPDR